MQNHVKNYIKAYGWEDPIPCEVCGSNSVDLHHILKKSSFGKKRKDEQDIPSNIIALCRKCHCQAHYQIAPYLTPDVLIECHSKKKPLS